MKISIIWLDKTSDFNTDFAIDSFKNLIHIVIGGVKV